MELPLTTPSLEHVEFDEMCAELGEFEPLPTTAVALLEPDQESEEATSLDEQILAGLVSPC